MLVCQGEAGRPLVQRLGENEDWTWPRSSLEPSARNLR
jgi:hypothetical protein